MAIDPSDICVYTSITGERARLRDDQRTDGSLFICYAEKPQVSSTWLQRRAYRHFISPRRNARVVKILSHLFVDTQYSVWLDGNVSLLVPPAVLVSEWLKNADIAAFRHHKRDCTYEEGVVCGTRCLDDPNLIADQMMRYQKEGLPPRYGLAETTVIVRRHSVQAQQFNNYWWSEHCRFSVRDQLSFMYTSYKTGIGVNLMTPCKLDNAYFDIDNGPAGVERYDPAG